MFLLLILIKIHVEALPTDAEQLFNSVSSLHPSIHTSWILQPNFGSQNKAAKSKVFTVI